MSRPCKKRFIEKEVEFTCFKPEAVPKRDLERVELTAGELEALRLFNLEELNQEEASIKMQVSASTFNRLIKAANKKTTDALVNGKGIRIYKTDGTHNCK